MIDALEPEGGRSDENDFENSFEKEYFKLDLGLTWDHKTIEKAHGLFCEAGPERFGGEWGFPGVRRDSDLQACPGGRRALALSSRESFQKGLLLPLGLKIKCFLSRRHYQNSDPVISPIFPSPYIQFTNFGSSFPTPNPACSMQGKRDIT